MDPKASACLRNQRQRKQNQLKRDILKSNMKWNRKNRDKKLDIKFILGHLIKTQIFVLSLIINVNTWFVYSIQIHMFIK